MGNQQTMCCADTTGCQRVELATTSSFDHANGNPRGRPRLLRRVLDTFRPSPKRDQQKSVLFKGKFASSSMEMNPVASAAMKDTAHHEIDSSAHKARQVSSRTTGHQLRTLSSMSTQSEMGVREARCDNLTRRASYCSAREGVETERERLEPEGSFCHEATE